MDRARELIDLLGIKPVMMPCWTCEAYIIEEQIHSHEVYPDLARIENAIKLLELQFGLFNEVHVYDYRDGSGFINSFLSGLIRLMHDPAFNDAEFTSEAQSINWVYQ